MADTEGAGAILRFYAADGRDHAGRRLSDLLAWNDDALEHAHDYIQWMFPLPEASGFNAAAPILTEADIAAFQGDAALRARLRKSLRRILAFYGLALETDGSSVAVIDAGNHAARVRAWCMPGNHNLLRITRILRCLHLLGLDAEAGAFLARLERLQAEGADRVIGPVTARYWRAAVT